MGGEGDENDAAVGPGLPWHLRLIVDVALGEAPPPRSGPCPELVLPAWATAFTDLLAELLPLPPCGEDRILAEGRARGGRRASSTLPTRDSKFFSRRGQA